MKFVLTVLVALLPAFAQAATDPSCSSICRNGKLSATYKAYFRAALPFAIEAVHRRAHVIGHNSTHCSASNFRPSSDLVKCTLGNERQLLPIIKSLIASRTNGALTCNFNTFLIYNRAADLRFNQEDKDGNEIIYVADFEIGTLESLERFVCDKF